MTNPRTTLSGLEIDAVRKGLMERFYGDEYDLIRQNCNHFSEAAAL